MTTGRVVVEPYVWDRDRPTRREGIRIIKEGRFFFADYEDARLIADALHDLTDRHEQFQQQTKGRN